MSFGTNIDALFETYKILLPMSQENEDRLWKKFRLDWNFNSNRIEGNTLTYGETEALLILGTEPKRLQRDIREMKAHDLGIEYLQRLVESSRPITEGKIRELNKIILKQNYWIETETADGNISRKEIVPGTYKTLPNHVRLRGGGIHKFTEPQDVPARMNTTVKSINKYIKNPDTPLPEFLAHLHHDFINTHPFDDGNGRVVRMLLNYACQKLNWPPTIIKDKNKSAYLVALEHADTGNLSELTTLMHTELEWSLRKAIAAAKGENIEDPDDIDKEIHNYVNEHSPPFLEKELPNSNFQNTYRHYIIPLRNNLEKILSSLSPLFNNSEVKRTNPETDKRVIKEMASNSFAGGQIFGFDNHISGISNKEIHVTMLFECHKLSFEIKICVDDKFTPQETTFIFPISTYNTPYEEKTVEKYCTTIGRHIFDIVKLYKENPSNGL